MRHRLPRPLSPPDGKEAAPHKASNQRQCPHVYAEAHSRARSRHAAKRTHADAPMRRFCSDTRARTHMRDTHEHER